MKRRSHMAQPEHPAKVKTCTICRPGIEFEKTLCRVGLNRYAAKMKPIVNIGESIGKTVGRRVAPLDSLAFGMGMQKAAIQFERAMKRSLCPKGVFRFRTHEDADEWMLRMLARRAK